MERRYTQSEVRARDHFFEGYASRFYNGQADTEYALWDGVVERISPSAFQRAIKERHDCIACINHDPSSVLGRVSSDTLRLKSDDSGLKYKVKFDKADPDHVKLKAKIANGSIKQSSFAMVVTGERWEKDGDKVVRWVDDVDLLDVSPVTHSAYSLTDTGFRSTSNVDEARKSFEKWQTEKRLKMIDSI